MGKKEGKQKEGGKASQYPNYLTLNVQVILFQPNHWTPEASHQWTSSTEIQIPGRTILFLLCLISTNGCELANTPQGHKITWSNKYNTKAAMSTNE